MHASTKLPAHSLPAAPAIVLALVLLASLAVGGVMMLSMGRIAPGTRIEPEALANGPQAAAQTVGRATPQPLATGPGWERMTTPQKLALYPLAERWAYLSEAQKRHWLVLAQSFAAMPESEQERLHERMTAWASLSAQQRSQARLNFATTRNLAPHDIQAEWETYQALSEAEKQRLAARAAKPKGAATALKPIPSKRLAHVPTVTDAQAKSANPPKIVFPAPAAVHLPPVPEPTALPPSTPVTAGENPAPEQTPSASEPRGTFTQPDPLPPVYLN